MADDRSIPRRTFVKGLAAAAAATAAAGTGVLLVERHRGATPDVPVETGWRADAAGLVLHQNVLVDDEEVHRSGGRRSALPTAGYAAATVAKATVVGAGDEPPRVRFPGAHAGLVVPAPGLLPRDEWAAHLEVRNTSGDDVTRLPAQDEPLVLLTAGAIVVWLLEPHELAVTNFATDQQVTWRLEPGAWPAGAWRPLTVRWRSADSTMAAAFGDAPEGHRVAGRPRRTPPPATDPPGGTDDGVLLGGSPVELQPFEVRDLQIRPTFAATRAAPSRPTVTVDAGRSLGRWSPGISGTLAVHAGFDLDVGSTRPDVRDRQFELVFDEAGSRLVRVGGPLQLVDVASVPGSDGHRYGWSRLDAHLDALLVDRPQLRLHLTLDFTPELLQPEGADHRAPPTDPERWAAIAVDVVEHVADRYGDQLHSVTLWNEPDLTQFWTGTPEQLHQLWEHTQRALMAAGSHRLLGNPEYATTAGAEGFFAWLAERPEELRTSVEALYVHDFQQDLRLVRERLRAVRAAADAAGVGDVPVRITEYNLALGQLGERRHDPDSWYATQPPHFTSEYAAAYALHFLWETLDEAPVDTAVFAAIGAQELFWGEQALVTSTDVDVRPHPAWSTIALLARLGGERVAADATGPAVRALATRDEDGAVTVVYANFRPYRGFLEDLPFALRWAGLPDAFTWTRWQLDRDHLEDGRMVVVGRGDERDLPDEVRMGALGVGGVRIVPS